MAPSTYDDGTEGQSQESGLVASLRKQLAEKEKTAKENDDRATKAERQLAFVSVGIKLDDPKTKYFVNGYDGEITPDEIKKAALEAGFLTEEKPAAETQQLSPEQQAAAAQAQVDQQAFASIETATTYQDTSGINHRAGMEKAIQEGGIEGMTAYMISHGIPVADQDR